MFYCAKVVTVDRNLRCFCCMQNLNRNFSNIAAAKFSIDKQFDVALEKVSFECKEEWRKLRISFQEVGILFCELAILYYIRDLNVGTFLGKFDKI